MDGQEQVTKSSSPQSTVVLLDPIAWQAEEYEAYRRDMKWYIGFGVIVALMLTYCVITRQWIFLALTVVMAGAVLLLGKLQPKVMQYQIDDQGVHMNDKLLQFDRLKTFWISEGDNRMHLNLISTAKLMPIIAIKIDPQNKDQIRMILGVRLPESNRQHEDWIDKLNRVLRV